MLHLGYDAKRLFNNFTGLGNYSRTLIRNLVTYYPDNLYFLFTPRVTRNEETSYFLNSAHFNVYQPESKYAGAFWRTFGVKKKIRKQKIQLFHGLSHELPVGIQKMDVKTVVTIHDLIFKHYPAQYNWIDRKIYDSKFRYACEIADRVVAISNSTKEDIINFYGIAPNKIEVIYQSCSEAFMQEKPPKVIETVREKYGLPDEFMLYVGSLIERKNLLGVIKAMQEVPESLRIPLAVVGNGEAYKMKVLQYLKKHQIENWIYFINPSYGDLPALYQKASIFLYPSFCEGFGIPIIEAIFSNTPVITSNISSLPEAAGPYSWLADPSRPGHIAEGIEKILTDEAFRKKMVTNSFGYVQKFQGEPLTRQMMNLYLELLGVEDTQSGMPSF